MYISRNLRMGRAIQVPGFGVFTLTAPEVQLEVKKSVFNRLKLKLFQLKDTFKG